MSLVFFWVEIAFAGRLLPKGTKLKLDQVKAASTLSDCVAVHERAF
jgi:hypothetical protein